MLTGYEVIVANWTSVWASTFEAYVGICRLLDCKPLWLTLGQSNYNDLFDFLFLLLRICAENRIKMKTAKSKQF